MRDLLTLLSVLSVLVGFVFLASVPFGEKKDALVMTGFGLSLINSGAILMLLLRRGEQP